MIPREAGRCTPCVRGKTLAQYTDWMKGIMAVLPDGRYEVKSLIWHAGLAMKELGWS